MGNVQKGVCKIQISAACRHHTVSNVQIACCRKVDGGQIFLCLLGLGRRHRFLWLFLRCLTGKQKDRRTAGNKDARCNGQPDKQLPSFFLLLFPLLLTQCPPLFKFRRINGHTDPSFFWSTEYCTPKHAVSQERKAADTID